MSFPTTNTATGSLLALTIVASVLWSPIDAQNRILGGYETTIKNVPFQLALEGGGRHMCGGSVLTPYWALTAAHCVYDQPVRWLAFRSGSTTRERGGSLHPVKYYIYHDKYVKKTLDYDVAVVYVKVPFPSSTSQISMPNLTPIAGEVVTVTGWGYLQQQQLRKPKELMATDVFIFDWDDCKKMYSGLTPRMLCAGDSFKDICNGDSGGPLIRGLYEQVGIASWAYKCGDGLPSVYTNISVVTPWIHSVTGMNDYIVFPN